MIKHTQTIRQLLPTNCLSVFDHFVGLALKGLKQCAAHLSQITIDVHTPFIERYLVHSFLY